MQTELPGSHLKALLNKILKLTGKEKGNVYATALIRAIRHYRTECPSTKTTVCFLVLNIQTGGWWLKCKTSLSKPFSDYHTFDPPVLSYVRKKRHLVMVLYRMKGRCQHRKCKSSEKLAERCGRVVITPASWSGGSVFKSGLGDRLSWMRFFVVFLISLKELLG
jgi:hypothetical protein